MCDYYNIFEKRLYFEGIEKRKKPFVFDTLNYEIWAAAVGAAAAAASVGYTLSGAGTPAEPNLSSSSQQLSNAEASLLPEERQLAAAAAEGGTALNSGYKVSTSGDQMRASLNSQIQKLQQQLKPSGKPITGQQPVNPAQIQQQIAGLQSQLANIPAGSGSKVYTNSSGQVVPESQAVTNFGQYGGAQTQATIATQNAGDQLSLEQQYDPQFIAEALKEEQLADPDSVAARAQESNLIQQQINAPITNPVSGQLNDQIQSQVQSGKGLDDFDTGVLNSSVADALNARGGQSGTDADYTSPLTTGQAGNQRQLAGIQVGQSFLGSGTTPQDVQYRQEQQNLANLSAEVSGQTPTSEFSSLSNASRGPNPTTSGTPLPTMADTLQTAGNAALTTQQQQEGQSNNWMAGLSTVINASGALGAITNNTGAA